MLKKIQKYILNSLVSTETIDVEDMDIYSYSMQVLFEKTLSLLSITLTFIVLHEVLAGITLLICFKAIRECAGGYHAKTFLGCFILSNFSFFTMLFSIKYDIMSVDAYRALFFSSVIFLISTGPIASENKSVTSNQYRYFYRKEVAILFVMLFLCVLLAIIHLEHVEMAVESAVLLTGITSVFVKIKGVISDEDLYL